MSLQTIDLSSLRQHFEPKAASVTRSVMSTPVIDALLDADAVVAIGVSGGKDSVACALAVARHLDMIGHTGPRILVHATSGASSGRTARQHANGSPRISDGSF